MFEYNEDELIKVKASYFIKNDSLTLTQFPSKQKKKFIVLNIIVKEIPNRVYTEKEISELLKKIYPDFVTIRRALIDFGLMNRTRDGKKYWLVKK